MKGLENVSSVVFKLRVTQKPFRMVGVGLGEVVLTPVEGPVVNGDIALYDD